tara:strand:+ start:135 stop:554 length:420 start_codon:yes stop_codon:yes gene_type:complete
LVKGTSLKEAALLAGYSDKNAQRAGSTLLSEPKISKRVAELRSRAAARSSLTLSRHLDNLEQLRNTAVENGAYGAAVTAEISRGKAAGLYVERKELLVNKVQTLTREEIVHRIREIHDETGLALPEMDKGPLTIEHASD